MPTPETGHQAVVARTWATQCQAGPCDQHVAEQIERQHVRGDRRTSRRRGSRVPGVTGRPEDTRATMRPRPAPSTTIPAGQSRASPPGHGRARSPGFASTPRSRANALIQRAAGELTWTTRSPSDRGRDADRRLFPPPSGWPGLPNHLEDYASNRFAAVSDGVPQSNRCRILSARLPVRTEIFDHAFLHHSGTGRPTVS
jgi:hypothetical protein